MKKFIMISLAIVFSMGSTARICLAGPYSSWNIGAVIGHDSDWSTPAGVVAEVTTKTGYGLALAIGNEIRHYRFEAELAYRCNALDDISISGLPTLPIEGDATSIALIGNIYKDLYTNNSITPFIGVGIGSAYTDVELGEEEHEEHEYDTVFAYQAILGATFNFFEGAYIDISYRYFATTDPDLDGIEIEYETSNIMVGFRINFGS